METTIQKRNTFIAEQVALDIDPTDYGAALPLVMKERDAPFAECNDFSTGAIVQKTSIDNFVLECGARLERASLGYCVYASDPINPIIIVHPALTGTARAVVPQCKGSPQGDGWWNNYIGSGKMLDTDHYTVVVLDHFGGNGGSTTGSELRAVGAHDKVTFRDGVLLASQVLQDKGVRSIHAVVGGSLGGGQATQWMFQGGVHVEKILEISGSSRANKAARTYFQAVADLLWEKKDPDVIRDELVYSVRDLTKAESRGFTIVLDDIVEDLETLQSSYSQESALATARKIGFLRFVTPSYYDEKIAQYGGGERGKAGLKSWLNKQGRNFTKRFSADALATLSSMAASFQQIYPQEFAKQLQETGTSFIGYHVDGDRLFHLKNEQRYIEEVLQHIPQNKHHQFRSIVVKDRFSGHDRFLNGGFLQDSKRLQTIIRDYDVATEPRCEIQHVGDPIPNDCHAISCAMPTWQDVVAYETEETPGAQVSTQIVKEKLRTAYPRFKLHGNVETLISKMEEALLVANEDKHRLLPFPNRGSAERCAQFIRRHSADGRGSDIKTIPYKKSGLYATIYQKQDDSLARQYWQHAGEIVTSRLAESVLNRVAHRTGVQSYRPLQERIAQIRGLSSSDTVSLYPSGMAAAHGAFRLAETFEKASGRNRPTLMFGFPYVDNYLLQAKSELGVRTFMRGDAHELQEALHVIEQEEVSAVVVEVTSNPGLGVTDIRTLSKFCQKAAIPLIVDDTVGDAYNVDVSPYADLIYTSLSKRMSGVGTVTGGSLVINPKGALYKELSEIPKESYFESMCHQEDLDVIFSGIKDYEARMEKVNASALRLATFFKDHPAVKDVYYPYYTARENYETLRREHGGYGGLMSITLHEEQFLAPLFYNRLEFNKGPGLGINTTIACPINLLTHFHELETFADRYGVSPFLIRISVGSDEDADELVARASRALDSLPLS